MIDLYHNFFLCTSLIGVKCDFDFQIVISLIQNRYDLVCAPYTEKSRNDPKEYRVSESLMK